MDNKEKNKYYQAYKIMTKSAVSTEENTEMKKQFFIDLNIIYF